jgi:purine nucleoside phosphorylase
VPGIDHNDPALALIAGSGLSARLLAQQVADAIGAELGEQTVEPSQVEHPCKCTVLTAGAVGVLARHGDADPVPAHLVDHEANLRSLAQLGYRNVLALSSVGSLRSDWSVGTVVLPDDFFALGAAPSVHRTIEGHRVPTFDHDWRARLVEAWACAPTSRPLVDRGVYAQTTGPRFETPAEVRFLAGVADLVGMTVASECIVAGELELTYAALCQVDNLGNGLAGVLLEPEDLARAAEANAERLRAEVAGMVVELLAAS